MAKRSGAPESQLASVPTSPDVDFGLGEFFEQFPQPVPAGTMTFPEVAEIKARNKVLARVAEDLEHLSRMRALLMNEKVAFIRGIGARVGLGPRDELTIDDESGAIRHVGVRRYVQPSPPEPVLPEAAEVEATETDAPAPPVN